MSSPAKAHEPSMEEILASIRRIISGELAPDDAIATGVVEVLRGRGDLLDRFATIFHLAA